MKIGMDIIGFGDWCFGTDCGPLCPDGEGDV